MDKKQTNERTEFVDEQMNGQNYTNFRKEPSYDGDLSPCQV